MIKRKVISALMASFFALQLAWAGEPEMMMPLAPECLHCFKPIVGLYYSYVNLDTQDTVITFPGVTNSFTAQITGGVPQSLNGLGVMWGLKYGSYFAVILGLNHYFKVSSTLTFTITNNTNASTFLGNAALSESADLYYTEGRGYLPVIDGFDLIAAIGAGVMQLHNSLGGTLPSGVLFNGAFNSNNVSWRFGLGADYFMSENWGIEAFFHYMPLWNSGSTALISDFWTLQAGIDYLFS